MLSQFLRRLRAFGGFDGNSHPRGNVITVLQMHAILRCIEFIRARHATEDLIFLPGNENAHVRALKQKIRSGCSDIQEFIFSDSCTVRECAAALFGFLRSFDEGLLPLRTQHLIRAHNANVPSRIVAWDALGCLIDELRNEKNTNFIVAVEVLHLMKTLSTHGSLRPTELNSSQAPYFLMPILFDKKLSTDIIMNFSQCMNIVNELILQSNAISPNYHAAWRKLRAVEATQQLMSYNQLHDSLNYEVDILATLGGRALRPPFHLQPHLFHI